MDSTRREPPFESLPSRASGSNDWVERSFYDKSRVGLCADRNLACNPIWAGTEARPTLGILGTSIFIAPLQLFFSAFQDELLILR